MSSAENKYMYFINLLTGEGDIPAIVECLVRYGIDEDDKPQIIDVIDKLLRTNTNRFMVVVQEMLSQNTYGDFTFISDYILDAIQRSDEYIFPISEIIVYQIVCNDSYVPGYMKRTLNELQKRYKMDIFRCVIQRMEHWYTPLRERISKINRTRDDMFNESMTDLFKNSRDIEETVFYNWRISPGDIVHIICNNSSSFKDNVYSDVVINRLNYKYTNEEDDHYIEDVLYKLIQGELSDVNSHISYMSYPELMDDIECKWQILTIFERICYSYYLHMTYEENMIMDILIEPKVRKTYCLIYYYFVEIEKDMDDEDEMYRANRNQLGDNMSIISRLCE